MPQEFHVVRCYNCETFQVQIVKKVPKWQCKMCGEKQSVKKEYGKGSGKDCRLHVQKLNQLRIESGHSSSNYDENLTNKDNNIKFNDDIIQQYNTNPQVNVQTKKWAEFVDVPNIDDDEDTKETETYHPPKRLIKNKCSNIDIEERPIKIRKLNNSLDINSIDVVDEQQSQIKIIYQEKPSNQPNEENSYKKYSQEEVANKQKISHKDNILEDKQSKWAEFYDENQASSENKIINHSLKAVEINSQKINFSNMFNTDLNDDDLNDLIEF